MVVQAIQAIRQVTQEYIATSEKYARQKNIFALFSLIRFFALIWDYFYILGQLPIVWLFKAVSTHPRPWSDFLDADCLYIVIFQPPPKTTEELEKPRGRVAVIGAGLTGVSSAA